MSLAVRRYAALSRASAEVMFAYRAGFALNLLGTIFYLVAMFYLWQTIFAANPGALGGFTWPEMRAYLLVAFLLNSLLMWGDEFGMLGLDVQLGRVAILLVRPLDIQAQRLAETLGSLPVELASAGGVGLVVVLAFGGVQPPPDVMQGLLFALSALLATTIKFGLIFCVALTAFWTTGVWGVSTARVAISNIFSGAIVPLAFFPGWLQALAGALPFQAMVSTPALIYLGKLEPRTELFLVGVQAAWAVGLLALGRFLWRHAVRAANIQGG